jgi:Tfp pilus assembly protein PilO
VVSISKGLGYLVSTISVVLLGMVSWKSASEQPLLFACLLAGMAASVLGMVLRWISHRRDQAEKERIEQRLEEHLRAQKPIA